MTINGFEDSGAPILLYVDDFGLGTGPFDIDGLQAQSDAIGIICNVGDQRFRVPWQHIRAIQQQQAVVPLPPAPTTTPPTTNPPPPASN